MRSAATTDLIPLPTSTPITVQYPCQVGTQREKNRLLPTRRSFKRVPSAQEGDAALRFILRKYWGHSDFRGPQLDVCRDVMRGCDVLVVAPTGLGKSVCFQVPALTAEYGITIVVSPLVALMQDQVLGLREKGIFADRLCEKVNQEEVDRIKRQLSMGHPELRLLYVTPEAIFNKRYADGFTKAYRQRQLNRIVIDEAHVIDEWGSSFRPIYRQLGELRARFPDLPITALTASATPEVRQDIINVLRIKRNNFAQYVEPFNRKNLFYEVRYRGRGTGEHEEIPQKSVADDIVDFITKFRPEGIRSNSSNGVKMGCVSGLIYCRSRVSVEEMASMLSQRGVSAKPFHAMLSEYRKDEALRDWKSGKVECIVATIAFGMGVDQAHVRYVIHYDLPKSFEGYYQETGRAGRDGHMSRCILYYGERHRIIRLLTYPEREDAARLRSMLDKDIGDSSKDDLSKSKGATSADVERAKRRAINSFKTLQHYAESTSTCRHVSICRYFGEKIDDSETSIYCNGMCDICAAPQTVRQRAMVVTEDVAIASQVAIHDEDQHGSILRSSFDQPSTSAMRPTDTMDILQGSSSPFSQVSRSFPAPPCPASGIIALRSSTSSANSLQKNVAVVLPSEKSPSVIPESPLYDPAASPVATYARRSPTMLLSTFHGVENSVRPGVWRTSLRRTDGQHLLGTSGPSKTLDQTTNDALNGAGEAIVIHGVPRSPEHAENKRKAREAVFKDVQPVTGQGLSPMYNGSEPKRKRVAVMMKGFKTPFKDTGSLAEIASLRTPETPTGPSRVGQGQQLQTQYLSMGHVNADEQRGRKEALVTIRESMVKTLGDRSGSLGDQVWAVWGRTEVGSKRDDVLKRAARDIEAQIASDEEYLDNYQSRVTDTLSALKILRHKVGVEIVVTEQYARLNQSCASNTFGRSDLTEARSCKADRVVDTLLKIKHCVERVKRRV